MAGLSNLVEVMENNMECVVLKVKDGVQMELICLGCFDGNETMFRLTKGDDHTCTVFSSGGKPCPWKWGMSGYTLVSDSLDKCGRMIESCITEDFGIYIGADTEKRKKTLHIRSLGDLEGCREEYRLMVVGKPGGDRYPQGRRVSHTHKRAGKCEGLCVPENQCGICLGYVQIAGYGMLYHRYQRAEEISCRYCA